jgi:hypothetical protein
MRLVYGPAEAVPFRGPARTAGGFAGWGAVGRWVFWACFYYRLSRGVTMPTLFGLECLG